MKGQKVGQKIKNEAEKKLKIRRQEKNLDILTLRSQIYGNKGKIKEIILQFCVLIRQAPGV